MRNLPWNAFSNWLDASQTIIFNTSIKRYLYNALSLFLCLMQLLMRSRFDSNRNLLSISSTVWKANWTIYFVWLQWLCQKGKFDLWAVCQIIMKKFIILNDESNFMRNQLKSSSLSRIMKLFIQVHYIHVSLFYKYVINQK